MLEHEQQVAIAVSRGHRDKLETIRAHRGLRTFKDAAETLIDNEWNAIQATK